MAQRADTPKFATEPVSFLCQTEAAGAVSCVAEVDEIVIAANSRGDYTLQLNNTGSNDLTVTTIITATPAVGGDTYDITSAVTGGSTVSYPQEARITATVTRNARIAGLVAFADITDALSMTTRIDLVDDGTNGDSFAADGIYSALVDYTESGFHDVKITVNNSAGRGTETTAGELSPPADGSPPPPLVPPAPVMENFSRSAIIQFDVVGMQSDDHADNPTGGSCTGVTDDNVDTRGQIDFANDIDCFSVVPSDSAAELVFRVNGFSRGMDAVLTIFNNAGVQIAVIDKTNTENLEGGIITTIATPDMMGMKFTVRHADTNASAGGYDVSVGAKISSDNSGNTLPPPVSGCTNLFGSAPGFILCGESDTTCSFNARTGGGTCDAVCTGLGSTCVGAVDNAGSSCQEISGNLDTCQTPRLTEICICERSNTPLPPPPPPPPPTVSCTALFGSTPGFVLCGETATTCSFNARTGGGTCDAVCTGLGSTCVGAIDNVSSSCQEVPGGTDTCLTPRLDEICICERP